MMDLDDVGSPSRLRNARGPLDVHPAGLDQFSLPYHLGPRFDLVSICVCEFVPIEPPFQNHARSGARVEQTGDH